MFLGRAFSNAKHCGKRPRGEQGSALLEFAIVIPFLVLLVGGLLDYSMAFKEKTALVDAVHAGARVAAMAEDLPNSQSGFESFLCSSVETIIAGHLTGSRLNPANYNVGFALLHQTSTSTSDQFPFLLVVARRKPDTAISFWSRANLVVPCASTVVRVDLQSIEDCSDCVNSCSGQTTSITSLRSLTTSTLDAAEGLGDNFCASDPLSF